VVQCPMGADLSSTQWAHDSFLHVSMFEWAKNRLWNSFHDIVEW
jgi:hypothetical protein